MSTTTGSIYEFRYVTDDEYIDFDTLFSTQSQFGVMLKIISREIDPKFKLKVSVAAIKHNSFDLQLLLDVVHETLPLLPIIATPDFIGTIRNVFEFFRAYFNLRKLLAGKKPTRVIEDGNRVTIFGGGNSVTVNKNIYNIYSNNFLLDSASRHIFSALESDDRVSELQISTKDSETIKVVRDDFSSLSARNELIKDSLAEEIVHTKLIITRAVLFPERRLSWGFIYNSRRINAMVKDNEFNQRISMGELTFGHGDRLEVDLRIIKEYDSILGALIEKSYEVIHVRRPIPAARQTKMDLNH